jgi:DNA-binding transcriptional LysR family regulator
MPGNIVAGTVGYVGGRGKRPSSRTVCARMHSLDWNDLRYFLAVCRAGTLAGAARGLHVRHSTVGRRVEALETALGVSLFTRAPDGFVLTNAGSDIVSLAEEAERAVAAVERRVAGRDKRIDGIVRVATSETFSGFLMRRLPELQAQHPALTVEVLSGNAPLDLMRREADLAIRFMETTQADLICKRLCDAGWSLYSSQTYIARAAPAKMSADLAHHDVVGFDETMARSPGAIWLEEHRAGARIVVRCNSLTAALNASVAGMGVVVLPCFLADAEPSLRRLTDEVVATRPMWMVFHPDVAQIGRVRTVIDFVSTIVGRAAAAFCGERTTRGDLA